MNSVRVLARSLGRQQPIVQRRFNSSSKLITGNKAEGNAFVAEREAVKHHAAESSGRRLPSAHSRLPFHR